MTADLAEYHSTATLAAERMENEQSERLRLEKEKSDLMVNLFEKILLFPAYI